MWHDTKARWWTFYYVQVGLLNPRNPINISNVWCNKITRNSKIRNHRNYSFFYAIPHGASISIYNGSWKSISEVDHWSSFMFHCYEWNLSSMKTCCHAEYTTNVKGRTGFQGGCDFEKQREHVSNHLIFDAFGKGFLHHHCDLILHTMLFFWRNLQKLAYSSLDLSDTHVKLLHVVDQVIAHIYGQWRLVFQYHSHISFTIAFDMIAKNTLNSIQWIRFIKEEMPINHRSDIKSVPTSKPITCTWKGTVYRTNRPLSDR